MKTESWFASIFKTFLYVLGISLALKGVLSPLGLFAAVFATLLGSFFASFLVRTSIRKPVLMGAGLLTIALGIFFRKFFLGFSWMSVESSFRIAEFLEVGFQCLGGIFLLRFLALSFRLFAFLEAGVVTFFYVWKLSLHRDFSLHRPQGLSDFAWEMGTTPLVLLILIGSVLFASAFFLLIRTERKGKVLFQGLFLALMSLGLFLYFENKKIDSIPRDDPLGLTATDEDSYRRGLKGDQGDKGDKGDQNGNQGQQGNQGNDPSQGNQGGPGDNQGSNGGGRSEEMPFKNDYSSQQKNMPVAVVRFEKDYTPPDEYYYFRQTAFSLFNGHRLVQDGSQDTDVLEQLPSEGAVAISAGMPRVSNAFDAIPTLVYLIANPTKPYGLTNMIKISRVANPNPSFFRGAYHVDSMAPIKGLVELSKEDLTLPNWYQSKMRSYLEIPEDHRYRELAEKIVSGLKPELQNKPFYQMLSIVLYLGKTGYYSLKSDHADDKDPTADFLFGNMTGFCVHFSHAAVYLARSLGIPARVGAGYAISATRRGQGENLAIMERDAHAWPEIYLEPYGWIIMDVPIQNNLDPPTNQEPSQSLQNTLGQIAKEGKPDETHPPEEEEKSQWLSFLLALLKVILRYLVIGLIVLLILGLILCYLYKAWRLWAWKFQSNKPQLRMAYRALLDRLVYMDLVRFKGESREAFAARVCQTVPSFEKMTWDHLTSVLGSSTALPLPEAQLIEMMKVLKKTIIAQSRWWKIGLVTLNPFSWMRVH